jgi:hypothetical protein
MAQYSRDCEDLAERIRAVVGQTRVDVTRFRTHPQRELTSLPWKTQPVIPPLDGRPVLAVTDLGIAPLEDPDEDVGASWRSFFDEHRAVSCPVRVLVPYPAARWPRWANDLTLVEWDRATTINTVRATLVRLGDR